MVEGGAELVLEELDVELEMQRRKDSRVVSKEGEAAGEGERAQRTSRETLGLRMDMSLTNSSKSSSPLLRRRESEEKGGSGS